MTPISQSARNLRSSHGQALAAIVAVGLLYLASPNYLGRYVSWLPFAALLGLLPPLIWDGFVRPSRRAPILNWVVCTLTIILAIEVTSLIVGIVLGYEEPVTMLGSAALLWLTNWLVFTIWYWRIDAGGPHARHERGHHTHGDFLFPQMTMGPDDAAAPGATGWMPGFVDYLFLAFTTNTALSPTDAPALSRRAKMLMIVQALISLSVIVLIAARAVNLLPQSARGR